MYPGEAAGVLMLEATHPRDEEVLHADARRAARSLSKVLGLPAEMFRDNLEAELDAARHVAREIAAAGSFPQVPLTVITGGVPPPQWLMSQAAIKARQAHQRELVRLSRYGEHLVAPGSGHFPQLTEPELVLAALRALMARSAAFSHERA
jgi:pimeloyl-ACP methyl ester carboxylesterase